MESILDFNFGLEDLENEWSFILAAWLIISAYTNSYSKDNQNSLIEKRNSLISLKEVRVSFIRRN